MAKDDNSKICAILSYFLVGIIWYLVDDKMKKSDFAKYHVKQALILLIVSVVLSVGMSVISLLVALLLLIPVLGAIIGVLWTIIYAVVGITLFVLWILGIVNAASDKKAPVPIIGKYARKLTF